MSAEVAKEISTIELEEISTNVAAAEEVSKGISVLIAGVHIV